MRRKNTMSGKNNTKLKERSYCTLIEVDMG